MNFRFVSYILLLFVCLSNVTMMSISLDNMYILNDYHNQDCNVMMERAITSFIQIAVIGIFGLTFILLSCASNFIVFKQKNEIK